MVSIVGRFLEHSRVMRFENGGDPRLYLSSGNCTTRDLTRRVELAMLVEDAKCKQELQVGLSECLTYDACTGLPLIDALLESASVRRVSRGNRSA